jgi:hypothetical protein
MKDMALLILLILGLFPILLIVNLVDGKLPEIVAYGLCPSCSLLAAGVLGWFIGWIYGMVALSSLFLISTITYLKLFCKKS